MVTAPFADLVGSTEPGPEDTRELLGEGVRRIVEAVEAFGEAVKDLAGDGARAPPPPEVRKIEDHGGGWFGH